MQSLELRIPPLAVLALFAAGMAAIAYAVPGATFHVPWRLPLSSALAGCGVLVAFGGVLAFRRHKTTVNPLAPHQSSSLVATGIYRLSRNSMYLGFHFVLAAFVLYLANGFAALLLPAFVVYMNRFQIAPEERALSTRFGSQFSEYTKNVRRWL